MSEMFAFCSKLSSIPDISKWNTKNVNNMSYMFKGCESLSSIPDISKLNTNNIYKSDMLSKELKIKYQL